ncbi:hypothetical protein niasHT_028309 [Heterodera trifolii]|uniref:DH domain-containing protein n=1 Tax=Heterodera trifolii TaxID=157864 RepID=A0ABD2JBD9_9BILA
MKRIVRAEARRRERRKPIGNNHPNNHPPSSAAVGCHPSALPFHARQQPHSKSANNSSSSLFGSGTASAAVGKKAHAVTEVLRSKRASSVSAGKMIEYITVVLLTSGRHSSDGGLNNADGEDANADNERRAILTEGSGTAQMIEAVPGRKLIDTLQRYLQMHDISTQNAEFLLEKSSTPILTHFFWRATKFPARKIRKTWNWQHKTMNNSSGNSSKIMKGKAENKRRLNRPFIRDAFVLIYAATSGSEDFGTRRSATTAGSAAGGGGSRQISVGSAGGGTISGTSTISAGSGGMTTIGRKGIFFAREKLTFAHLCASDRKSQQRFEHFGVGSTLDKFCAHQQIVEQTTGDQQEAIWEIITTERRYILQLQSLEDMEWCFVELQKQGFMRDVNRQCVFLNYSQLLRCNLAFWQCAIVQMLERSRHEPLNALLMQPGFDSIPDWSFCYIDFNIGHADSHAYVHKRFAEFVKWAEQHTMLNRQKLVDVLSSPMQRTTRYSLLLKAVQHCAADTEEKIGIQGMIECAEAATIRLNYELNNNDLRLQLSEIMKTIESYDVLAQQSNQHQQLLAAMSRPPPYFNLMLPMPFIGGQPRFRRMYTRGDLKMREGRQSPKQEMHCILFTGMLLICCRMVSRRNDRLRVTKPPMHISNLHFHHFTKEDNFGSVVRLVAQPPSCNKCCGGGHNATHRNATSVDIVHRICDGAKRCAQCPSISNNWRKNLQHRHSAKDVLKRGQTTGILRGWFI